MVDKSLSSNTKMQLGNALKKLMTQKSLDKITIQEVVNECGLNRRTFYYHFQDIYELLSWIYEEEALYELRKHCSYGDWKDGLVYLYNYIGKNKKMTISAFNSLGRLHLEGFVYSIVIQALENIIDEIAGDLIINSEYKAFVADYYANAMVGMLMKWIENDMREVPDDITEKISITVQGTLRHALERFAQVGNK